MYAITFLMIHYCKCFLHFFLKKYGGLKAGLVLEYINGNYRVSFLRIQ